MEISIFGLGYVGCVSMGCLAKNNHNCIGVDKNELKVKNIQKGKPTIIEKGIEKLIEEQFKKNRITATTDYIYAITKSEISFICVGTPSKKNGNLDLSAIFNVSEEIAIGLKEKKVFHTIVIRSTVMPGTNERVKNIISEKSGKKPDIDFAVVSNPEFLREGSAIEDFNNPPYTLIGTNNAKAINILKRIYKEINAPFFTTEIEISEMIKFINNAYHAHKIVFANEVGNICKTLGIDSHALMDIVCMDNKLNISKYYLKPGFAFGGSCLPKDLKALKAIANDHCIECPAIESIEKSNQYQKKITLEKIIEFGVEKIGFLGLSFKGGTDDIRNSPIVDIIEPLIGKGFNIKIYDKNIKMSEILGANKEFILNKIPLIAKLLVNSIEEIIAHSSLIVIVNNEKEFAKIFEKIDDNTLIYDLVNLKNKYKHPNNNYTGCAW